MKRLCFTLLALAVASAIAIGVTGIQRIFADSKPAVQLNTGNAAPREVEDNTRKAILRDYTAAWQEMQAALGNSDPSPLNENFTGFALDRLTQRIKDQHNQGMATRILDHGHKVDAIFYSMDGSAIELRDTASIETQLLDGSTVIHSDQAEIRYVVIMTGAEDRWKVRVLQEREP